MMPRRTAGRSPSIPPSSSAHPPQPADEEQETALAISDQRTLYLVNIFIGNAARFLNNFADLCQDKLADVHRRILRLDVSLTLLEAKLRSTCPKQEFEDDNGFKTMGSSSQSILSNLLPLDNSLYLPCVPGESSRFSQVSTSKRKVSMSLIKGKVLSCQIVLLWSEIQSTSNKLGALYMYYHGTWLELPDANGKENFTARERTSLGTFGEATNSMVVVIYFSGASTDSMVEAIILSSLITTVDSNGDIFLVRNCFAC